MLKDILSYGIGTLVAVVAVAGLLFLFVRDITQKKHSVLRNYPVIGRLRYFFEEMGEYFRQYFFAGDRDEMPFNRATRGWVYRLAKNEGGIIGFGSTYDLHHAGALIFVNHPFPVLEEERQPTPTLLLGEGYCKQPFEARSIVNISGMSFGAISTPAVRSLSRGAAVAGCWLDTGEGGLSPYHVEGGCDVIMQIGTAKYGVRDAHGNLSNERLIELARTVKAFEIKLSQGAKPGKGGVLPGGKVTPEIAAIRGIPQGEDSISPNRHRDAANTTELLDQVAYIRSLTGRPVGIKTAIGGWHFLNEIADNVLRRGLEYAPDFIVIDGGEGGSGAAPQALFDHMSLSSRRRCRARPTCSTNPVSRSASGSWPPASSSPPPGPRGRCASARTSSTPLAASCSRSAASRRCAATPTHARRGSRRTTRGCSAGSSSRRSSSAWRTTPPA